MIAKEVIQAEAEATKYFELFEEVEMTNIEGETVSVLQSQGKVNVEQLTSQKESLETQITVIDVKLTEIAKL